ncbi:MAG TPA: prepilin-type N-terminal cleavage/methylation domain-containing protein [Gemmatimonadaceae bacterium]|nr:prepilin-type N-terminal cleavage/methylation domain-containing protein [Gemmatimonadaceae bacterium]
MLSGVLRRGTTLVELLVVLVLLAIVGGATMHVAVGQQRFLAAVERVMEVHRTSREGADIPRQELRIMAPASGAIYGMAADRVEFRSLIGASVICEFDSSRTTVSIPGRLAWSGLTSWVVAPRERDTVLVFDAASDSTLPRWRVHTLATAPDPGGRCPTVSGLARTSAEENDALSFRLTPPLESSVGAGASLRFVRRARYQLYRAGDGYWYLGFLDCAPARSVPCSTIQPVSGPFAPAGVRFTFVDSTGTVTADPAHVARVDVLSRAESDAPLRAMGLALGVYSDSVLASIALRNR